MKIHTYDLSCIREQSTWTEGSSSFWYSIIYREVLHNTLILCGYTIRKRYVELTEYNVCKKVRTKYFHIFHTRYRPTDCRETRHFHVSRGASNVPSCYTASWVIACMAHCCVVFWLHFCILYSFFFGWAWVLCVSGINLLPFYYILLVFWLVEISLVLDTNNAVASHRVSKVPSCSTASGVIARMAHCCVVSDFTFVF